MFCADDPIMVSLATALYDVIINFILASVDDYRHHHIASN
jgi:hypothetical protein